jgi:hypothetical protein
VVHGSPLPPANPKTLLSEACCSVVQKVNITCRCLDTLYAYRPSTYDMDGVWKLLVVRCIWYMASFHMHGPFLE